MPTGPDRAVNTGVTLKTDSVWFGLPRANSKGNSWRSVAVEADEREARMPGSGSSVNLGC